MGTGLAFDRHSIGTLYSQEHPRTPKWTLDGAKKREKFPKTGGAGASAACVQVLRRTGLYCAVHLDTISRVNHGHHSHHSHHSQPQTTIVGNLQ